VDDPTVGALIDGARGAYDALATLGEDVEDEWSYVTDLSAAWTERLDAVAAARGEEATELAVATAVDALVAEAGLVDDPHRAIDWLSTFPQVLLVALGERP
jgi:hypothetical protein